ncbi:interactor of constitutive active ROPs protein [Trifolium repens]|nr:interactor of constitutive active ROPs protein [Trifolium repens]
MLVAESSGPSLDIPEELLQVLPSDPFEQLDVARKITSIALSTRVNTLQSEISALRAELAEKDNLIDELQRMQQSEVEPLHVALSEATDKLALAEQDKEKLLKENASLSSTVKKLTRDVSKLEVFRKALMQSLQEDEDKSGGSPNIAAMLHSQASITSTSQLGDEDAASLPPSRSSPMRTNTSDAGNSSVEDRESDGRSQVSSSPNILLASRTTTPHISPPGSPPIVSASVTPTRTSKPASPRRHAVSLQIDRSSMFSSTGSMSSVGAGSHTGRTRVDGKEFFRQVRSRLSYEQFGAFLANVKELNSHKQTKEDTLKKADEIFGPENKDLYTIFEGLISRNVH